MRSALAVMATWTFGTVGMVGVTGTTLLSGAAAVVLLAGSASADIKAVQPRFVVVAKDGAAMRCSDAPIYYPVRTLKTGDVLKIDGEGGGWLRAEYPAGTRAYVKADEGSFDAGSGMLKLVKASKLMAANELGARPWWYLLDADLPAGMTFSPAEPVKAADGMVEGWLVPAPAQARGYVRAEHIRPATPDEAASYNAPLAAKPAPKAADPKPIETMVFETKVVEAAKPVEPRPAEPKPVEIAKVVPPPVPVETPKPVTPPPAEEIVVVKPVDATPIATPVPTQPAPVLETVTTVKAAPTPTPAPATSAKVELTRRIDDLNVLRDMFDRVMRRAEDEAELATVVSEFNRKIDALATSGDDGKIRFALEQRREALHLRQEILETKRRMQDTSAADERYRMVRSAVEDAQKQAIYTIVGRILPSTVYDGKRGMPLMYRVESADFSSTRTIGYVLPRDGVDLLPKMGKIVGIVGDAKMDPALTLYLVAPMRVDELQVVGGRLEAIPGTTTGVAPTPVMEIQPAPMTPAPTPTTPPAPAKPAEPVMQSQPVATPGTSDTGEINK